MLFSFPFLLVGLLSVCFSFFCICCFGFGFLNSNQKYYWFRSLGFGLLVLISGIAIFVECLKKNEWWFFSFKDSCFMAILFIFLGAYFLYDARAARLVSLKWMMFDDALLLFSRVVGVVFVGFGLITMSVSLFAFMF